MNFNEAEIALIIEALAVASAHRLSLAVETPGARVKHEAVRWAMDALRERIVTEGMAKIINVTCPKCGSENCFPTDIGDGACCAQCGHEFSMTGEPDTSDIPEANEDWFKRAKLRLPNALDDYCPQCLGPCLRRPRHGEMNI